MRESTSISEHTRRELLDILDRWEHGAIDAEGVFNFADELYYQGERGWPQFPEEDKNSIIVEVLDYLETLYAQHIVRSDVPAIRKFLEIGDRSPADAWEFIHAYWDKIDLPERLQALINGENIWEK